MNGYTVQYDHRAGAFTCGFCGGPTRAIDGKFIGGRWYNGGVVCDECLVLTGVEDLQVAYDEAMAVVEQLAIESASLWADLEYVREEAGYAVTTVVDDVLDLGMQVVQVKNRLSIPQLVWSLLTAH